MLPATYGVDNDRKFRNAIARAKAAVGNLSIPLGLIGQDFYKSEKGIFQLQGPGQYEDLSPAYKKAKLRTAGFLYPILKLTGRLAASVTSNSDPDSIYQVTESTLTLGTKVTSKKGAPYGFYLNKRRPFFIIGPEAPAFATSDMQGRLSRWSNILNSYVLKVTSQNVGTLQSGIGPLG